MHRKIEQERKENSYHDAWENLTKQLRRIQSFSFEQILRSRLSI